VLAVLATLWLSPCSLLILGRVPHHCAELLFLLRGGRGGLRLLCFLGLLGRQLRLLFLEGLLQAGRFLEELLDCWQGGRRGGRTVRPRHVLHRSARGMVGWRCCVLWVLYLSIMCVWGGGVGGGGGCGMVHVR
jgi:hypothetical protein